MGRPSRIARDPRPNRCSEERPMTQIRSLAQPVHRRPGELGVHSLDLFNFLLPDAAAAEKFYRSFGLDVREEQGKLNIYTQGHPHHWGSLVEGPRKKLNFLSFGAFEDDLPRFRYPDATLLEIRGADKSSPNEKSAVSNSPGAVAKANASSRSKAPLVRPRRLAHILVFTRDIPKTIEFYHNVLGLRLSDRSGDMIAFMHGIHGSDHHMIAFVRSEAPGLHHLSWGVGSIQEIGLGAMQMADKGFMAGWGLGRHVLGSNYFHYVRDPWGSYAEYSSDIDYIPVDHDWESGDHPPEDSFYVWGPVPPPDFAFNHEAQS